MRLIRVIGVPVFNHKARKVLHKEAQRMNLWSNNKKNNHKAY